MSADAALDFNGVAEAAELFGFAGTPVNVEFDFGNVWVIAAVDRHEHEFRLSAELGALTDFNVLSALCELPHDMPVPAGSLPRSTRAVIDRAPQGAVFPGSGSIVRRVRRPVHVAGAIALGRWARASRRVGPLGTLCGVGVLTSEKPQTAGTPALEAALYGQGLAWLCTRGDVRIVQMPEPSVRLPGAYQWWLCELVYEALTNRCSIALPTD